MDPHIYKLYKKKREYEHSRVRSERKNHTGTRYMASVEYDGSLYNGWRDIEAQLREQTDFQVVGVSRTDKGVHANAQIISIYSPEPNHEFTGFDPGLDGVEITDMVIVDANHSIRHSVVSKTYVYRATTDAKSEEYNRVFIEPSGPIEGRLCAALPDVIEYYKALEPGRFLSIDLDVFDSNLNFTVHSKSFVKYEIRRIIASIFRTAGIKLRGQLKHLFPGKGLTLENIDTE